MSAGVNDVMWCVLVLTNNSSRGRDEIAKNRTSGHPK
jgi:hypothetical protein